MASTRSSSNLLQKAAIEGNINTLLELLQQDPLLLDRFTIHGLTDPPLHVAVLLNHTQFVSEILRRNSRMAKEFDSNGFSPLHLAAAKGHLAIVILLLQLDEVDTDLCSLLDADGRNPLHLAAMYGHLDCLRELIGATPKAARALVDHGGTILHLCVKNNQLESLKLLVEAIDDIIWLNAKDDYGFTILHLAVSNKQIKTVEYLVSIKGMEVNAVNSNGLTALDILVQSKRDANDLDIAELLRAFGASRSTTSSTAIKIGDQNPETNGSPVSKNRSNNLANPDSKLLTSQMEGLMIVSSIITTMAFQAATNPPGGLWQDDKVTEPKHKAGRSIMASTNPDRFSTFITFCTISFMSSFIGLFLLVTNFPSKRSAYWAVVNYIISISFASIALAYGIAISYLLAESVISQTVSIIVIIFLMVVILIIVNFQKPLADRARKLIGIVEGGRAH